MVETITSDDGVYESLTFADLVQAAAYLTASYHYDPYVMENRHMDLPLAQRPIVHYDPTAVDASPGRRLRVFAGLISRSAKGVGLSPFRGGDSLFPFEAETYAEALEFVSNSTYHRDVLGLMDLRLGTPGPWSMISSIGTVHHADPSLHSALQDLGDEINEDIREACFALDDPNLYYPGIDEGIEPVTDEHVELVMWGLQRELDRELRSPPPASSLYDPNPYAIHQTLPAVPLQDLPFRVKRALAERRRWRFRQWGIGREQWLSNSWSLWDVPVDEDYVPRRNARLIEEKKG